MEDVTTIELIGGYTATVNSDTCQRLRLKNYDWRAQVHKRAGKVYAVTWLGEAIYMHRLVAGAAKGQFVDHIDGNGLNNTDANLRLATPRQNSANQKRHKTNTTGYKGLWWSASNRKWCVQISCKGTRYHLGMFNHSERAAEAYDRAALALHGEFAALNFPEKKSSYKPRMPEKPVKRLREGGGV